ncbi:MAG: MBL fold metallo-hydrolase [Deltaproteobacteria bacterium]|nr:MBL fold metallo-hydrolase [Deltaproteobacteria bacterium]
MKPKLCLKCIWQILFLLSAVGIGACGHGPNPFPNVNDVTDNSDDKAVKAVDDAGFELDADLTVTQLLPDTFVVEHRFPWAANSLVMKVGPKKVLMVDTPYTPEATQRLIEWILQRYPNIQIEAVNTGFHVDNLGGNAFLKKMGIPVYGSETTKILLETKGEHTRTQLLTWLQGPENVRFLKAHEHNPYVAPDTLFRLTEGTVLHYDNETVEIFYPGPSHSEDNLVVYARTRKLLFGGCAVKASDAASLGFTGDANMENWPVAIEAVLARYSDAEIVVPGHGPVSKDLSSLHHTLALLNAQK